MGKFVDLVDFVYEILGFLFVIVSFFLLGLAGGGSGFGEFWLVVYEVFFR